MRDYEKLVKGLRYCFEHDDCGSRCPYFSSTTVCADERAKEAADAIEELQARNDKQTMMIRKQSERTKKLLSAVPQWISVEERLPEAHHSVLCYCPQNNCTYTAVWNGKVWIHFGASIEPVFYPVTHWMPLPEPPKEVE